MLQSRLPGASDLLVTDIGPALAVHSGPGLVGVGVHGLPGVTF